MARPRKLWSALKAATKTRKLNYYKKQGLSPRQVASRYNAGTLGPQTAARGHAETPEHGVEQAVKQPNKFRKYLNRKQPTQSLSPQEEARRINDLLDRAYASMRRLREYVYYNDATVLANVYGGETSESGRVDGMPYHVATWTVSASVEAIRSRASDQYKGNPWWYH